MLANTKPLLSIERHNMDQSLPPHNPISPETLKSALKAFKKRLKLTALDDDSHLGKGAFSGGHTGVFAIRPPNQFSREVWDELCRQGKLRDSGHGLYELPRGEQDRA